MLSKGVGVSVMSWGMSQVRQSQWLLWLPVPVKLALLWVPRSGECGPALRPENARNRADRIATRKSRPSFLKNLRARRCPEKSGTKGLSKKIHIETPSLTWYPTFVLLNVRVGGSQNEVKSGTLSRAWGSTAREGFLWTCLRSPVLVEGGGNTFTPRRRKHYCQ